MVPRVTGTVRVSGAGATLAVELQGTGAPLLLVHGFPLDHAMWAYQLARLDGWWRVAPDLRGAGASEAPADAYSMAQYADDLDAVCEALGIPAAVWCGFSMGGYVLFELLRRQPDRVRALILCDTKAEADTPGGKRARDEQAALVEQHGPAGLVDRLVPKLLGATTRRGAPQVVEAVRAMVLRQPAAGVVGALRAMRDRPDSSAVLSGIAVPTLVLCGAEDEVSPPASTRGMAERIPDARYIEVPGAGHLAPLEQPEAVTEALRVFLRGL
jgi:pimeloyl-ACP methyl ester carboxylesterase